MDESVVVEWSPSNQEDVLWWSDTSNLLLGVSLEEIRPNLLFWSDTSDQGWGAHLQDHFVSALWSPAERSLSINLRELCTIRLGFYHFQHLVRVFADNTTALSRMSGSRGDVLPRAQCQGPASPSLGRGVGDHTGSPIHFRVPECGL